MLSLFWKSAAPTLQAVKMNTISRKLIHFHMFPRSVFLSSSLPPSGKFKPCCGRAGESEGCSMASSLLWYLTAKLDFANLYGLHSTHAQTQNSKIRRVFEKRRKWSQRTSLTLLNTGLTLIESETAQKEMRM